jgi:hypothetical protein
VSDPYRSAPQSGACARCRNPLEHEGGTSDLVCKQGCGRWIAARTITAMMPIEALRRVRAIAFKATPFAAARCLVCTRALEEVYAGEGPVLSFGVCESHGVWLDRASREDFELVFAERIREFEGYVTRVRELDRRVEAEALELAGDDTVDRLALALRIIGLERADKSAERRARSGAEGAAKLIDKLVTRVRELERGSTE